MQWLDIKAGMYTGMHNSIFGQICPDFECLDIKAVESQFSLLPNPDIQKPGYYRSTEHSIYLFN